MDETAPAAPLAGIRVIEVGGVPCTSVNSIDKVVKDEQVAARDMIVEIEHPTAGKIRMAGLPVKLSANPGSIRRHAPLLGEHSAEVLHELGLSEECIRALRANEIIGMPG